MKNYKTKALAGDVKSQKIWLMNEIIEFRHEPWLSHNSIIEYLDVLGCIVKWGIDLVGYTALKLIVDVPLPTAAAIRENYTTWYLKQQSRGRKVIDYREIVKAHKELKDALVNFECLINN